MRNNQHRRALTCAALLATTLALVPTTTWAHEKWFVDDAPYPVRWELLLSLPVLVALLTAAFALGALLLLRRVVGDPLFPNPEWLRPINPSVHAVLGIQTSISLVFMTVQGWLLAPRLDLPAGACGIALAITQLFVSFTFVTGWLTRLGGALLVGIVLLAYLLFPATHASEQLLFVGIGLFFVIEGRALFHPSSVAARQVTALTTQYGHYALPLLRIFTGLSILWLGFSEKLLNPDLALAFLDWKPEFNFMRLVGIEWFTDELFVYAAAAVEATVGVLLITGVLPRIVILAMWLPFNLTIPLLPPEELLGHLPILAVMYAVFLGKDLLPAPGGVPLSRVPQPV